MVSEVVLCSRATATPIKKAAKAPSMPPGQMIWRSCQNDLHCRAQISPCDPSHANIFSYAPLRSAPKLFVFAKQKQAVSWSGATRPGRRAGGAASVLTPSLALNCSSVMCRLFGNCTWYVVCARPRSLPVCSSVFSRTVTLWTCHVRLELRDLLCRASASPRMVVCMRVLR